MDRRVAVTVVTLRERWRETHRVADLAAAVKLTPSRLQHLFKDATQTTIREVSRRRRLQEAAQLIAATHDRISEICYYVGYHDPANFDHAFRREFGMSPREYRRSAGFEPFAKTQTTKS